MRHSVRKALVFGLPALGALALGLIFALAPAFNAPATTTSAAAGCPVDQRHLVHWQGGRYFLSGVNVPWQDGGFGADFATVEEWGQHTYSASATAQMFAALQASGVNTVRWWVFADGRGAPEFSANAGGAVTGFDSTTLASMADAVRLASQYDIHIVFNLWSFDMLMADSHAGWKGEHAGGHRDLITDASKRSSFITNALLPMLAYPVPGTNFTIGTHPNVLAWDLFNEPEFGIADLDAVHSEISQPVSLAQMQRFIAELAGAIHRTSPQLVTVGSAAMKWNSDAGLGTVGNLWKDSALTRYDPQGYLDFYQIHYYGWMNGDGVTWSYAPTVVDWQAGGFDKPVVVGELPANAGDTGYSPAGLLNTLYANCYSGAWAWSYYGVDGAGRWSDVAAALKTFNSAHASEVDIGSGGGQPTPPTATPVPPTATPVPPTATPVPNQPTATPLPPTATPVPNQPTATPVPPTGGSNPAIFADSLASGWQNWSWDSKVNLSYTSKKKVGTTSIAVTYRAAWAGLYLHSDQGLSTQGYSKIRFWAHGAGGNQRLMVWTTDGNGNGSQQVRLPKLANKWLLIEIPLSQLGNPARLTGLAIQDASGTTQRTFYIDQIELAN